MSGVKIANETKEKDQGSLDFSSVDRLFLLLNRYRFKVWETELRKLTAPQEAVNLLNAVEARIRQSSFRGTEVLTDAELRSLSEMCGLRFRFLAEQRTENARKAQERIAVHPWLAPRMRKLAPGYQPDPKEVKDVSRGHEHNDRQGSPQQSHHRRRTQRTR